MGKTDASRFKSSQKAKLTLLLAFSFQSQNTMCKVDRVITALFNINSHFPPMNRKITRFYFWKHADDFKTPHLKTVQKITMHCHSLTNIIADRLLLCKNPVVIWLIERQARLNPRNPAYFPRAKHSSVTTDPFAAGTLSGKWTSILGSYSPITPMKCKHKYLFTSTYFHYSWLTSHMTLCYGTNNSIVKQT